jgi:hypothetical protein
MPLRPVRKSDSGRELFLFSQTASRLQEIFQEILAIHERPNETTA